MAFLSKKVAVPAALAFGHCLALSGDALKVIEQKEAGEGEAEQKGAKTKKEQKEPEKQQKKETVRPQFWFSNSEYKDLNEDELVQTRLEKVDTWLKNGCDIREDSKYRHFRAGGCVRFHTKTNIAHYGWIWVDFGFLGFLHTNLEKVVFFCFYIRRGLFFSSKYRHFSFKYAGAKTTLLATLVWARAGG